MCEFIFAAVIILLPYSFLGEGMAATISLIIASLYFVFYLSKRNIKVNKNYFIVTLLFTCISLIGVVTSNNYYKAAEGVMIYFCALIFYVVFSSFKEEKKNKFIEYAVQIICVSSVFFIVYQGVIHKQRIDGNIGYANTYALLLLIALTFNSSSRSKLNCIMDMVLILAILYTGSRSTFVFLLLMEGFFIFKNVKEKKSLDNIESLILALFLYISLQKLGMGALILAPVPIYIIINLVDKLKGRKKNIALIFISVISAAVVFILDASLLGRITEISIYAGELQERLVFFEDSLKHILKYPLGTGINSFEYRQYLEQSAFYDVKYIHNSLLQAGYDMGIMGITLYLFQFILGIKLTYKKNSTFAMLYLVIYLHSLLDFDFSYSIIAVFVALIVAFNDQGDLQLPKGFKVVNLSYLVIGIYIFFCNFIIIMGNEYSLKADYNKSIGYYSFCKRITYKNVDVYNYMASDYNSWFKVTGDKEKLYSSIENLKQAKAINPYDPKIVGNLAFIYEKSGDIKQAEKYYNEFLSMEKYYSKMYEMYYNFIQVSYKENKMELQLKEKSLKSLYDNSYSTLNPRAKFMKDQLKK